ncbi:MAG: hypothetical protein GX326_08400 [Clostridiaceae bacterium]|nr:hypothetical protein [Clostridiaceae bacterium]
MNNKLKIQEIYSNQEIEEKAKQLFIEKRSVTRLDGWFLAQEINMKTKKANIDKSESMQAALCLKAIVENIPLKISQHNIFVGTQDDAFARTYALINPEFEVENFTGYCDPCDVFNDIVPNEEFTRERIDSVLTDYKEIDYVKELNQTSEDAIQYTKEAVFFFEQVTGHVIPDFRPLIKHGVNYLIEDAREKQKLTDSAKKKDNYEAMIIALESYLILAERYCEIAADLAEKSIGKEKEKYELIVETLQLAVHNGAQDLYQALQLMLLAWQCMCLEQVTNPYAFSLGNVDRIFEPYRQMKNTDRETAAKLFEHFLVFFNVGDRSWAISQNLILSGRDLNGNDLTNPMTYSILDAYFEMNLPQPILSVKLHKNTPDELYQDLGRFLFSPGSLTPSFFNDDALFPLLNKHGIEEADLPDYSVAGCQEPLIMGKDNGNTTNTWLNLAKILEITLNNGYSTLSGEKLGKGYAELGMRHDSALEVLKDARKGFYNNLEEIVPIMTGMGNRASVALSHQAVPFLSTAMGGMESGIDMRDPEEQGSKYNASGCLIHGLSVVSDSFIAIDDLIEQRPEDAENLLEALRNNFEDFDSLHQFLDTAPKFGNCDDRADQEAVKLATKVSNLVRYQKNYLGNSFRPDFSTPSTHLLYGYQVGALPNGRKAREQLNYGVDPLFGEANHGLGFRIESMKKLPYDLMEGGVAIHFGLNPKNFVGKTYEDKGIEYKNKVMRPLFFSTEEDNIAPFYLYVNVTTPETLRKVLAEPEVYAPSGVYIMRIHGTFVNFLDLSSSIQQDIIKRLDLASTIC